MEHELDGLAAMGAWEPHNAGQALAKPGWGNDVMAVRAQEPAKIARAIIGEHGESLGYAKLARVAWVYTAKELKKAGRACYAQVSMHSPTARARVSVLGEVDVETQPDFVVEINLDLWLDLTDEQRKALVHHELCHIDIRKGRWTLRGHTVEEFSEVIEAHGLWDHGLQETGRAIQAHLPGLDEAATVTRQALPLGAVRCDACGEPATGRTRPLDGLPLCDVCWSWLMTSDLTDDEGAICSECCQWGRAERLKTVGERALCWKCRDAVEGQGDQDGLAADASTDDALAGMTVTMLVDGEDPVTVAAQLAAGLDCIADATPEELAAYDDDDPNVPSQITHINHVTGERITVPNTEAGRRSLDERAVQMTDHVAPAAGS